MSDDRSAGPSAGPSRSAGPSAAGCQFVSMNIGKDTEYTLVRRHVAQIHQQAAHDHSDPDTCVALAATQGSTYPPHPRSPQHFPGGCRTPQHFFRGAAIVGQGAQLIALQECGPFAAEEVLLELGQSWEVKQRDLRVHDGHAARSRGGARARGGYEGRAHRGRSSSATWTDLKSDLISKGAFVHCYVG